VQFWPQSLKGIAPRKENMKYKILKKGDILHPGDEYFSCWGDWEPSLYALGKIGINRKVKRLGDYETSVIGSGGVLLKYRREIKSGAKSAAKTTHNSRSAKAEK